MRIRPRLLALGMAPLLFLALGCAPVDSSTPDAGEDPTTSESTSASADADPAACAADAVRTAGTLTIGTDSPAYDPWFSKNDPTNGEGFESAVAYAVAEKLGFTGDAVQWTKVPFNSSYAPFNLETNSQARSRSLERPQSLRSRGRGAARRSPRGRGHMQLAVVS